MRDKLNKYLILFNRIVYAPITTENNDFSLRHKGYNTLLFFASLVSFISAVFNFFGGFSLFLKLFSGFASLVLIFLYYLSRFRGYYNIWLSTVTLLLLLSGVWLMNEGSIGSGSYLYILSLVLLMIIAEESQHSRIFGITLLNLGVLYFLEYQFGDTVVIPYPSASVHSMDMIFVFLLIFFCTFFATRFLKRSYDSERKTVLQQKEVIEEQNKEHYASLKYASTLQQRIISNESQLEILFNDYFVFSKPRDIVSGDYYWVKEIGHYGIVVVADCTGHGVPAAFLSMLGISILEEIIKDESDLTSAAGLLEKLRDQFVLQLEKNNLGGERSQDGMDLGLCIVNYQEYNLQYAGANRPLVMVRPDHRPEPFGYREKLPEGSYTSYSFKPTKNAIGYNYRELPFVNHNISFYPKDTFYLFSDGYGDQFDAEDKRKFKVSRLKKELLAIQDLPLKEQGEHLENAHNEWKGETVQTDDIIFLGMRL